MFALVGLQKGDALAAGHDGVDDQANGSDRVDDRRFDSLEMHPECLGDKSARHQASADHGSVHRGDTTQVHEREQGQTGEDAEVVAADRGKLVGERDAGYTGDGRRDPEPEHLRLRDVDTSRGRGSLVGPYGKESPANGTSSQVGDAHADQRHDDQEEDRVLPVVGSSGHRVERSDVLTISMHMPLGSWGENHPETSSIEETGSGNGTGYNFNIPLPYGSGDKAYAQAMKELVGPTVREFDPDLIVIACGQDASQFDQNGRNLLSMDGFRHLGQVAHELASDCCDGRLLLCQEGGYAITYTGFCMYALTEGLLSVDDPMSDPLAYDASIEKPEAAAAEIARIKDRWRQLVAV